MSMTCGGPQPPLASSRCLRSTHWVCRFEPRCTLGSCFLCGAHKGVLVPLSASSAITWMRSCSGPGSWIFIVNLSPTLEFCRESILFPHLQPPDRTPITAARCVARLFMLWSAVLPSVKSGELTRIRSILFPGSAPCVADMPCTFRTSSHSTCFIPFALPAYPSCGTIDEP